MPIILLLLSIMEITPKMIDHLLHLARLESVPEKQAAMRSDLEKMVGFIEKLNEIDTSGVEPLLYMTGAGKELREDIASAPVDANQFLANAPIPDNNYFKVPTVIKK
jgi:aspartyl-tRNA(Asn)/glutamyl-tRNA(Gln) amidotransferase subunit C